MKKTAGFFLIIIAILTLSACGNKTQDVISSCQDDITELQMEQSYNESSDTASESVTDADVYHLTDILDVETGEFVEETVSESRIMSWEDFISQYYDAVDCKGTVISTDIMDIAIFELRDEQGGVLKKNAVFNSSGLGYDPFNWGINANNSYRLPTESFENDSFYIRCGNTIAAGPATGYRYISILRDDPSPDTLDGLWSGNNGNNILKISNANDSTLEFYPFFTRAWSPDENITARSTGDNCYLFDDKNGFSGQIYLEENTLVIDVSPGANIVAGNRFEYTKIDDGWKEAYKNFLESDEYLKTADYYDDTEKMLLLIDLTSDLIPELVITTGSNGRSTRGSYIYGYENGEVQLKTISGVGLYAYSIQNETVYFTVSELTGAQAEEAQYNDVVYIDWLKCTGNQIERTPAKIERYTSDGRVDTEFLVGNGAEDMYGLIQLALEENFYSDNFKPFMYQNIYFSLSDAFFAWDTFIRTSIISGGEYISW